MSDEQPTVAEDLRAAVATVLTKIAYYMTTLAMNLDLPAMLVEVERLQLQETKRRVKQTEQQTVDSLRNGESFLGRN
jgi:hypothetical protein